MEPFDHFVNIMQQVGFPAALLLLLIVLAPRYALRLLEVFRKIMDEFAEKLVAGIRPVVERHESVVNRAEKITSRQETAVTRLETMSQLKWSNGRGADEQS
jgi:CRISPR/Cas system-associated protein Csm6